MNFVKIDEIARKQNSNLLEVFIVFYANIASGNVDFEKVALKIFDLNKLSKEDIEKLKEFFNFLIDNILDKKDEFIKKVIKLIDDPVEAAKTIGMFFTIFLPKEVIFSKDPEKIKKALNIYPDEIKDSVIKALEMLSIIKLGVKESYEILKEVLNTVIILGMIMRLLEGYDESK
ncbi:MAG: hypothetical protein ABGX25_05240 [Nautiliaceae bacterium]